MNGLKYLKFFENFNDLNIKKDSKKTSERLHSLLKDHAIVYAVPYGNVGYLVGNFPWFEIIIFPKENENKVNEILYSFLNDIDYDYKITKKKDIDYNIKNVNFGQLFDRLVNHVDKRHRERGNKEIDKEKSDIIVVFFTPKEEMTTNKYKELYHVTYSPDVEKDGIKTGTTLKYEDRIYLWLDPNIAKFYAQRSFHPNKKTAWIYEVDVSNMDLYIDKEEGPKSFYVKQHIPRSKLTLIDKIEFS